MKYLKRTITILLTAAMLLTCLLPSAGCKKTVTAPDNPFDIGTPKADLTDEQGSPVSSDTDAPDTSSEPSPIGSFGRFFGASDYDASAKHGEKKLYHDEVTSSIERTSYNGLVFEWKDPNIYTYDISNPRELQCLCFDPTCEHLYKEYCTSSLESFGWNDPNDPNDETVWYPVQMVIDAYDYENIPIVYMSFRRSKHYFVNGVMQERESVYCIERYDMKTGKRTIVADNIGEIIDEMCTYGDYIYFTKVDAENNHVLCRVHKSGGEITTLDETKLSYQLLDVVDDRLYYLADERYIYSCDLNLSRSEALVELSALSGNISSEEEAALGYYFHGARGGYVYYYSAFEAVYSTTRFTDQGDAYELGNKMDLYRLPLNNLTAPPEKLVDDIIDGVFTEDTFFYCPAVYEEVEEPINGELNNCNGTIYALDLNTLARTTVCENTGFNFFFYHTIGCEDDIIGVKGRAYTKDTALTGGEKRMLIGKKSGGGLEFWYT